MILEKANKEAETRLGATHTKLKVIDRKLASREARLRKNLENLRKSNRYLKWGRIALLATMTGTVAAFAVAQSKVRLIGELETKFDLEREAAIALRRFEEAPMESLILAMEAGQRAQRAPLSSANPGTYQLAPDSPASALDVILREIQLVSQFELCNIKEDSRVALARVSDDRRRAFSTDGQTSCIQDGLSGETLVEFEDETSYILAADFSGDGSRLVMASYDSIQVRDSQSGKKLLELRYPDGDIGLVTDVSFSQDDSRIAVVTYDGLIQVWDYESEKMISSFTDVDGINQISFSNDNQRIVTASDTGVSNLWDIESGKRLHELRGHTAEITSARFSDDDTFVITASSDGSARIWDSQSGRMLRELKGHLAGLNDAIFTNSGAHIITASDDRTVRLWNRQSGEQLRELKGHTDGVMTVSVSPDSNHITTISSDNTVQIWDISDQPHNQLEGHTNTLSGGHFSGDGRFLVTVGREKKIQTWASESGQRLNEIELPESWYNTARFSSDGRYLVTTSGAEGTQVWDRKSGKHLRSLKDDSSGFRLSSDASFSHDGRYIVAAGGNDPTEIWNYKTGEKLRELDASPLWVDSATFNHAGDRIVLTGSDGTVQVWNSETGRRLPEFEGHSDTINSVEFSHDDSRIITASDDDTARVWDSESGQQLLALRKHASAVTSARFSHDDSLIVTTSNDTTAVVWSSQQGEMLQEFRSHTGRVFDAAFSPDSSHVFTASLDGTVQAWQVNNLDSLIERGCAHLSAYLISNPSTLEKLSACQSRGRKLAAVPHVVQAGDALAASNRVEEAAQRYRLALNWNSQLEIQVEERAYEKSAPFFIKQMERSIEKNAVIPAIENFQAAINRDASIDVSASLLNALCWKGSLDSYAENVLFACDKAVELNPQEGSYHDSRGVARALLGDSKGAIADLEKAIELGNGDKYEPKRKAWVKALKAGKNPFTPAELEALENEEW